MLLYWWYIMNKPGNTNTFWDGVYGWVAWPLFFVLWPISIIIEIIIFAINLQCKKQCSRYRIDRKRNNPQEAMECFCSGCVYEKVYMCLHVEGAHPTGKNETCPRLSVTWIQAWLNKYGYTFKGLFGNLPEFLKHLTGGRIMTYAYNSVTKGLEMKIDALAKHIGVNFKKVPEHYSCVKDIPSKQEKDSTEDGE